MKKTSYILPVISLSVLLTACGGGGGSGSSSVPSVIPTEKKDSKVQSAVEVGSVDKPVTDSQPKTSISAMPTESETDKAQSTAEESVVDTPMVENKPQDEPMANNDSMKQENIIKEVADVPPVTKDIWAGNFPHNKESVPVIYLVPNKNAQYEGDPEIKEKQNAVITLKLGRNKDPRNHYNFNLLDENAYYGYYRDSMNMVQVDNHYVYSFNQKAENKSDLVGLNATYKGKFVYSTRSIPEAVMPANLELKYENGEAKGGIYSHISGDKLFDVKTQDKARTLLLNPARDVLDNSTDMLAVGENSPDRALIDVHFINGKEGVENKVLMGQGGNEKYWGVIGAEKQ